MSKAVQNLLTAQKRGLDIRPKVGGFPYLAQSLREAGVTRNIWNLPSCQCLYLTHDGPVVFQGTPLVAGTVEVPIFDRDALIHALRADQGGEGTFPEFLESAWKAGVVSYDVDFTLRKVTYYGCSSEEYEEYYPAVELSQ